MALTMFLLFVRDGENTAEMYTYTFRHAASILIWGLFFGVSFVIFDIKKIPSLVSRIIHFVSNGVATGVWVVAVQTNFGSDFQSNLLQIIFFAIFAYIAIYWVLHLIICGFTKLFSKLLSAKD